MKRNNSAEDIRIVTAGGYVELLGVTKVGERLMRLEDSAVFAEARFGDTIEVESQPDGSFRFVRVTVPSVLETLSWVLAPEFLNGHALDPLFEGVRALGGHVEAFGGMLMLHVPGAEKASIGAKLDQIIEELQRAGMKEPE
jgi:hypothetical protein